MTTSAAALPPMKASTSMSPVAIRGLTVSLPEPEKKRGSTKTIARTETASLARRVQKLPKKKK